MQKKLFTHTDLDAMGCAIVGYRTYEDNLDVTYCDYNNVDDTIMKFLRHGEHHKYDQIFITDISVNDQVARWIDSLCPKKFILLDHHDTATFLNIYDWANVQTFMANSKVSKNSGTNMFYEFLRDHNQLQENPDLEDLVEDIRRYDTWEWSTIYNDKAPKILNDLFSIYGRERFLERFIDDPSPVLTDTEQLIVKLKQEEIDRYVRQKNYQLQVRMITGYNVGVVFADRFQSELGNELAKRHPECDVIAMIDPAKSISYRTVKDSVHVGEFAKLFGGGGHEKAAGSVISDRVKNMVMPVYFLK